MSKSWAVSPTRQKFWRDIDRRAMMERSKRFEAKQADLKRLGLLKPPPVKVRQPEPVPAAIIPMPVVNKAELIISIAAKELGVDKLFIKSQSRRNPHVRARWICFVLLEEVTKYSLPQIGRACGGRDHTTVLHGIRKAKRLIYVDKNLEPDFYAKFMRVRDSYYNAIGAAAEDAGKSTLSSDAPSPDTGDGTTGVQENGGFAATCAVCVATAS